MTLYNLHTSDLGYIITKFDSLGNIESSYTTSHEACECPAGHRHTCRHRQMLPQMLAIADTHWFFDYERGQIVDINGTLKSNLDRMLAVEDTAKDTVQDTILEPSDILSPSEIHSSHELALGVIAKDITPGAKPTTVRVALPKSSWRRI